MMSLVKQAILKDNAQVKFIKPVQELQHHHTNVPLYKHVEHDLDEQNVPIHNTHVPQHYHYPVNNNIIFRRDLS